MAVRLVGFGSRDVPASPALGSPVLPWPAEVLSPLAMACIASLRVLLQAAQRFASSAGYLGLTSSTGSRRGGDNCTAAACEAVLVLTVGWLLAGCADPCVIASLGRLVLSRGAGAIVLSCSSFLGGLAFVIAVARLMALFLRRARSCLLSAARETIAFNVAVRAEDAVALALPIATVSRTGRDCCHAPTPRSALKLWCAPLVSFAPSQPNQLD